MIFMRISVVGVAYTVVAHDLKSGIIIATYMGMERQENVLM